jgi:GTP cyclohydrolase I
LLARAIPVHSVCGHHMLSFLGTAHVGYLPGPRILGLSELAWVVELFARRPQVQDRLTKQITDRLHTHLQPRGVGVVIEAEHLCMTLRGVRSGGTHTTHVEPAGHDARGPALACRVRRPHHLRPVDNQRSSCNPSGLPLTCGVSVLASAV